jgi:hypothetical protein
LAVLPPISRGGRCGSPLSRAIQKPQKDKGNIRAGKGFFTVKYPYNLRRKAHPIILHYILLFLILKKTINSPCQDLPRASGFFGATNNLGQNNFSYDLFNNYYSYRIYAKLFVVTPV